MKYQYERHGPYPPTPIRPYAPSWVLDLTDSNSQKASNAASAHRSQLLAEMIPARTLPVGANNVTDFGDRGNYDMKSLFITDPAKWPRAEVPNLGREWKHSDVKDVAYPHLYKLFDKMRDLGELNQ